MELKKLKKEIDEAHIGMKINKDCYATEESKKFNLTTFKTADKPVNLLNDENLETEKNSMIKTPSLEFRNSVNFFPKITNKELNEKKEIKSVVEKIRIEVKNKFYL